MLRDDKYDHICSQPYHKDANLFGPAQIEVDALPTKDLTVPPKVPFYMQHRNQLGLAGIFQHGNQEPIFDAMRQQNGERIFSKDRLTEFGEAFVRACT